MPMSGELEGITAANENEPSGVEEGGTENGEPTRAEEGERENGEPREANRKGTEGGMGKESGETTETPKADVEGERGGDIDREELGMAVNVNDVYFVARPSTPQDINNRNQEIEGRSREGGSIVGIKRRRDDGNQEDAIREWTQTKGLRKGINQEFLGRLGVVRPSNRTTVASSVGAQRRAGIDTEEREQGEEREDGERKEVGEGAEEDEERGMSEEHDVRKEFVEGHSTLETALTSLPENPLLCGL